MTRADGQPLRLPRHSRAAALLVAATAVIVACDTRLSPEARGPDPGGTTAPPAHAAQRAGPRPPEAPTGLRLPDGSVVPIRTVDTRDDGLLAVPDDVRSAGWWRGSSRLGDPFGATLVAGHVDSVTQGLGAFAAVLALRADDRLTLRSPHLRQDFTVTSLRLVPQGPLRDRWWTHGAAGARRLVLVTCAPPYDRGHGGYQRLAVVTALPVAAPSSHRTPR